ncbi:GNAT family N-acetyltransferase [bacterium]|nr:GNAT family N-acetyltransferase [bacterium]MCI0619223.1 GNAT family N-acetyltransferase [bacterium]
MNKVEIRELSDGETLTAARVLGRGMRDNPIHIQVFGLDANRREKELSLMFVPVLRQQVRKGIVLAALISGELVGVTGMVPPKCCQLTIPEKMAILPALLRGSGLKSTLRVLEWTGDWSRNDSRITHWHLGPVAIDRHLQGQGIGSALLNAFCQRIDNHRSAAYLETDKEENVTFYKRFRFEVVDEHNVLGIKNWFMFRDLRA